MSDDFGLSDATSAVCVLGASRSGTSLTTRILNLVGLYLGPQDRMFSATSSNPMGFWEHAGMSGLNEKILELLGGSWKDPPEMSPGWERSAALKPARDRARLLLGQTFDGHGMWGWKDPRNCLTLPFWQSLLPDIRYVICLRNPLDVAASLERRDGMPAEQSHSLWLAYMTSALKHTSDKPRLLVSYEEYFESWRAVAGRLAGFIGTAAPVAGSDADRAIDETVDSGLRHHRTDASDGRMRRLLPDDVATLYLSAEQLRAQQEANAG